MKRFIVTVPEIHYQDMSIEAATEEEAIQKVLDGDGTCVGEPEYAYTLDNKDQFLCSEEGVDIQDNDDDNDVVGTPED